MLSHLLGFDLDDISDSEIGESDGMGFGVGDMLVNLFGGEEVEFFELLDGLVFLHHIRYQVYNLSQSAHFFMNSDYYCSLAGLSTEIDGDSQSLLDLQFLLKFLQLLGKACVWLAAGPGCLDLLQAFVEG